MLISNIDLELLKLCGLCRYLPRDLTKKYKGLPTLCRDKADLLVSAGFIKEVRAVRQGKARKYCIDLTMNFPMISEQLRKAILSIEE